MDQELQVCFGVSCPASSTAIPASSQKNSTNSVTTSPGSSSLRREEVRSSLKSFGKATASARPFAWLHGLAAGGAGDGRPGAGGAGLSSGLGGLAQLGSSLGGLAPAEGDGLEGPDESGPEEVRWSAAQPVYNDFEL